MHEASLMRALMRGLLDAAAQNQATRVTAVTVRLGALSHMSPGHFREHFEQAAAGTIAAGARIETIAESDIASPTAADVVLEAFECE
ncbi:MAG: hydrogenase maturation nickel metallochaperone HypA [Gammaproteobacteria bacterium]|nr:hydrogenase maturation nickel metallochaperone HypA [Gammaproteobacteria bacterium]MCP5198944.1 hydrogenase maturation nickel metallochaperone HypA [Gammaproteobacteria bacterium]